jgi:hypothetical protein
MTDLHKIRAEIDNLRNKQNWNVNGGYYEQAIVDCLAILDAHIAEAERKPSGEWESDGHGVWELWSTDIDDNDVPESIIRVLDDGWFGVEVFDNKWVELEPIFPTLRAAQLAAEAKMKKMEEKHVS